MFELTNEQRKFLGLDPVLEHWDRVAFNGDKYRPESILYFDDQKIKKHVISTEASYKEIQYDELTENREFLLPKTKKGKAKKLTPSVLESKTPVGVYFFAVSGGEFKIASHTTQKTFYSSHWIETNDNYDYEKMINDFIGSSPADHLEKIEEFRNEKRRNIKYKSGDFFAFKINRTEYGFGRILFDVNKARKKKLIPKDHGLRLLMGPPLLVKLYAYKSDQKNTDIDFLKKQKALPSDYMMDNIIFYGQYEIIGNAPPEIHEFDFPISYGHKIDSTHRVFLQWGLIHKELPEDNFKKYTRAENGSFGGRNPYGYYSIGFYPAYDSLDIIKTIKNNGIFDFSACRHFKSKKDLRNPANNKIRAEIFNAFGLNPDKDYEYNRKLTGTEDILQMIKTMM